MIFLTLAILWSIFLGLIFTENKIEKSKLMYNIVNVAILGFYIWNVSNNFNIQNTAALLMVLIILCISNFLLPNAIKSNNKKAIKINKITRIVLSCINLTVMIVHVIIFVILA